MPYLDKVEAQRLSQLSSNFQSSIRQIPASKRAEMNSDFKIRPTLRDTHYAHRQ